MGGLIALLTLPSLVLWSISVLKEPMNVFMVAAELICAVAVVRAPRWWQRALAVVAVVITGMAMESLRQGGMITAIFGTIVGIASAMIVSRGRRVALALIAAPIVIVMIALLPAVQTRALSFVRELAFYHAGHVLTPGYSYKLVNAHYYADRLQILHDMPPVDAGRFVVTAVTSYFTHPLPWEMESRTLRAYMPEQVAWYVLVLLVPAGIYAGLKRDHVLTCILAAHVFAVILIVALTSGNIGTLIRHRALALPYLIWFSAAGAHECVRRFAGHVVEQRSTGDGDR